MKKSLVAMMVFGSCDNNNNKLNGLVLKGKEKKKGKGRQNVTSHFKIEKFGQRSKIKIDEKWQEIIFCQTLKSYTFIKIGNTLFSTIDDKK